MLLDVVMADEKSLLGLFRRRGKHGGKRKVEAVGNDLDA